MQMHLSWHEILVSFLLRQLYDCLSTRPALSVVETTRSPRRDLSRLRWVGGRHFLFPMVQRAAAPVTYWNIQYGDCCVDVLGLMLNRVLAEFWSFAVSVDFSSWPVARLHDVIAKYLSIGCIFDGMHHFLTSIMVVLLPAYVSPDPPIFCMSGIVVTLSVFVRVMPGENR